MRILVDADGCPVVPIAIEAARRYGLECILLCDTSHHFEREGARTITVSKGADSVDFALVNMLAAGDVVVTQDYGLAAMCLARRAIPLSQNGMVYSDANIDSLLLQRHTSKKLRASGVRMKGPSKRTAEQDEAFARALENVVRGLQN